MTLTLTKVVLIALIVFQSDPPDTPPIGLWQSTEEGLVVRIEKCGEGFCGVAAGVPPNSKHKREDVCGKQMLNNFEWNSDKHLWTGHMQPPDANRELDADVTTDGSTQMTVRAHMMMMSKTLRFVPFKGTVTSDCEMQ